MKSIGGGGHEIDRWGGYEIDRAGGYEIDGGAMKLNGGDL